MFNSLTQHRGTSSLQVISVLQQVQHLRKPQAMCFYKPLTLLSSPEMNLLCSTHIKIKI